jgi:hypothetical protein
MLLQTQKCAKSHASATIVGQPTNQSTNQPIDRSAIAVEFVDAAG